MELNFRTTDTQTLATMGIPEFAEDVDPKAGKPDGEPAAAEPGKHADQPGTPAEPAKEAVEGAPAGAADKDKEAAAAEKEAQRQKGEADKEHNFALLRAANKRLESERDDALRLLNEKAEKEGAQKLEEAPDLETMDRQIAELRAEAKRLAEELPDMGFDKAISLSADLLQGQRNRIARDEQAVREYQEAERKRAEAEAADSLAAAQEKADALIDADPVLSHWKKNDQASYDLAAEQDAALRANPAWANVPIERRFAAVIDLVKTINPQASLPGAPAADPVKEAAKPAAVRGKEPAAPIRSLSDVPGGVPAPGSELENVSELSPAVLGNKFLKMTREQQDAYLLSLGTGSSMFGERDQ